MTMEFNEDKTFVSKPDKKVTHIDIHFDNGEVQTYDCKNDTYVVIPFKVYQHLKEVYTAVSNCLEKQQEKGL